MEIWNGIPDHQPKMEWNMETEAIWKIQTCIMNKAIENLHNMCKDTEFCIL